MFHNFKIFAKIQNFFKSTKFFCLHLNICFMECVPLCGFGVHLPVLFFVTTCRQAEGTYSLFATGRYVFSVTSPRDGLVLEPLLQSVWRRWRLRRGGRKGVGCKVPSGSKLCRRSLPLCRSFFGPLLHLRFLSAICPIVPTSFVQ